MYVGFSYKSLELVRCTIIKCCYYWIIMMIITITILLFKLMIKRDIQKS